LGAFAVRGSGLLAGAARPVPSGVELRVGQEWTKWTGWTKWTRWTDGSYAQGQGLIAVFFCLLAAATACHAILQYHFFYPRQYEALRSMAALQPDDPFLEGITYALKTGRVSSWFGNPNVLCGFLAMALPLVAAVGWSAGRAASPWRWGVRAAAVMVGAALFYAAYRTDSAGGRLVLAVGVVLLLAAAFLAHRRSVRTDVAVSGSGGAGILLFFLLLLCVSLLLISAKPTGAEMPVRGTESSSVASLSTQPARQNRRAASALSTPAESPRQSRTILQRAYYLRSGIAMWREKPWVGHGAGAYARLYPRTRVLGASETRYAHNFVVQLAAELGLVGLALFLWVIALAGKRFVQGLRSGSANSFWVCTAISLFLFLLDSLGDYTFFVREVYLDFCLLLGAFFAGTPFASGPVGQSSAAEPRRASHPVGSDGSDISAPKPQPSVLSAQSVSLSTQHSGLSTSLVLCAGLLLVLVGLWREIVPFHMVAQHRQMTEDLWKASSDAAREGKAMEQRACLEDALKEADRALAWDPGDPSLWQLRGNAYSTVGRPDAMRRDLEKAISLNPDSASMRAEMADLEWRRGNRDRAMEWMEKALQLYPLKSGLHEQRARFLAESGNRGGALEEAREAVRVAFTPLEQQSAAKTLHEIEKQ
jgi:O-antigen ligase